VVHDLADLLGVRFRQRTAEHREVLAEHEHEPSVDRAVAGDHAVARHARLAHAEVVTAVLDEHVPLLERVGIEQQLEAFARRELALGMLRFDPAPASAQAGRGALFVELTDDVLHESLLSIALATPT